MTICCPMVVPAAAVVLDLADSLLHFEGADASSTFTDERGHTWTRGTLSGSQPEIDTAQFKFGSASGLFANGFLDGDEDADFSFGTGDFTADLWLRVTTTAAQFIYDTRTIDGGNSQHQTIYLEADNTLRYHVNGVDRITGATVLATDTWGHIALTRTGTSTRLFLNGSQQGSTYTDSNDYLVGNGPRLGGRCNSSNLLGMSGWIDELRFVKGTAVWTANFTPPSVPYV